MGARAAGDGWTGGVNGNSGGGGGDTWITMGRYWSSSSWG
jgi:hypothetical protein